VFKFGDCAALDAGWGMTDNEKAVGALIAAWGKGELSGLESKAKAEELCTSDTVVEAKGGYEFKQPIAKSGYTTYNDIAGFLEWIQFLCQMEFPDFMVTDCREQGGDVHTKMSMRTRHKYSGKSAPEGEEELFNHSCIWTVKDGKIAKGVFTWDKPEQLDAIFEVTKNVGIVLGAFKAWGDGKFSGNEAETVAKEMCTDDIVTDATGGEYKFGNTEGYRVYEKIEGFLDWISFLEEMEFPHFSVDTVTDNNDGTVKTEFSSYIIKGEKKSWEMSEKKPFNNSCVWTIKDDKIAAHKFTWDRPEDVDKLFQTEGGMMVGRGCCN